MNSPEGFSFVSCYYGLSRFSWFISFSLANQIRFDNETNYVKLQLILFSRLDEKESEYNDEEGDDEEGDEEDEKNEVDKENPKYIHIYASLYSCFIA